MSAIEVTKDAMLDGQLTLWQPAKGCGYRFNLDPILLSGFAPAEGTVLDLGSGCGVLGLTMLLRGADRLIAVEKEPVMADLILRNAKENGLADRVDVFCADLRELQSFKADHVVSNPPYFKPGTGRSAANALKDAARFERSGGVGDFLECAKAHVHPGGTMSFVIRYDRKNDLLIHAEKQGCAVERLRAVRPHEESPPKMVMVELSTSPEGSEQELEMLTIHKRAGSREYTDEVMRLVSAL